MGSQVQVPVALESVYRTNCSLQALAIHFRVSATLGFVAAEPPMMAHPRHQLSLGSLRCRHTATGTSSAMPCVKLSLELPRHTGSGVTGALLQCIKDKTALSTMPPQWQATGLGNATSAHMTPRSERMYHPCPPFNYKREGPGPFLGTSSRDGRTRTRTQMDEHTLNTL